MRKITFTALFVFLTIQFAQGQFGNVTMPRFYSEFQPVVGEWSEYQIISKKEPSLVMRIAIVGKEGNSYWYETVVNTKTEAKTITKVLTSGNPEDQQNIKRMIVKSGNEPAMEMDVEMLEKFSPEKKELQKPIKMIDKGMESIKVPAGSFDAHHIQYQTAEGTVDLWIHKDVHPYGVVKSQSKDFEMVLTGYGKGATSQITETPRKFEMPKMPEKLPPMK